MYIYKYTLTPRKTFIILPILLVLLLFKTFICLAPTVKFAERKWLSDDKWTYKETFRYLTAIGCKFPIESTAQTIAEAGWHYTSDIAINANNICGMKLAKKRATVANGEYKNHAKYNTKRDCLFDLVLWQRHNKINADYINELHKKGYFIDVKYKENLKLIIKKIEPHL